MVLKLVPSLAAGNNKLPSEASRHLLFVLFSSLHLQQLLKHSCLPQQGIFLDQFNRNANLSGSQVVIQSQWY